MKKNSWAGSKILQILKEKNDEDRRSRDDKGKKHSILRNITGRAFHIKRQWGK